ncbi:MAG: sugar phosphate isomerase/epimerase, partial [Candidatus Omnitrophica bacterium]|nr:sugar phosphate isomerase/epimerase [Candidatus Omnitrophota bacterium]
MTQPKSSSNSRRDFLKGAALLGGGIGLAGALQTAEAMEPVERHGDSQIKLSLAAYSFRKELQADPPTMTLHEGFIDFAVDQGLGAIEPTSYYFPEPVTDEYLLNLKNRAILHGLSISGTAIGNTYTYPEGPERRKQVESTRTWIDRAALLGASTIRVFAGKTLDGQDEETARKNAIETLNEVLDYAGEKGVFLALENHGGIVTTAEQLLAIVTAVDHPWFGVNLDTGNFYSDDPYEEVRMAAPYAVTAQIKV